MQAQKIDAVRLSSAQEEINRLNATAEADRARSFKERRQLGFKEFKESHKF